MEAIREVKEGKIEGFRMKIKGIHAPAFGGKVGGRNQDIEKKGFTIIRMKGETVRRDIIEAPVPVVRGNFHPAPFPEEVIEKLILLLTKEGDVVLDPFFGSGTVGIVAKRLKRHFIGIEINSNYCKLAEERIKEVEKNFMSDLFSVLI